MLFLSSENNLKTEKKMKKSIYIPLYKTLADKLCDNIAAENLSDGDFFCTIKDISSKYNVAILTARRAVEVLQNNRIIISKPACGIFIKSINALHTFRARKNFILIINDHSDGSIMTSFWAMRLCAMLQIFSNAGFSVKVASSKEIRENDLLSMKKLLSGVIISASRAPLYKKFIEDKDAPPIMLTRRSVNIFKSVNLYFPHYDTFKLFETGCNFFKYHKKKKITVVNFDNSGFHIPENNQPLIFEEVKFSDFPSVQIGVKIAEKLNIDNESAIWVQDDFTAIGIYICFLSRGIDLTKTNSLLVTAGPSVGMTEQMQLPVIGFCPWESGSIIASSLVDIINNQKVSTPVIMPKTNKNCKI